MGKIKVSVLMPVYNSQDYIEQAIESVLAQQFDSFELIVLDDCSCDETKEVLERYSNNQRVRIYRNIKRLGETASRNKLAKLALGEYLSLCDFDDLMLPFNLKRLSSVLDKDEKIALVFADYLVLGLDKNKRLQKTYILKGKDPKNHWDLLTNFVLSGGSMIRKKYFLKVNGYNEDYKYVCDNDLWFKLAEVSEIRYLKDEIYYIYRRHPGSISKSEEYRSQRDKEYLKLLAQTIKRRYGNCNVLPLLDKV